MKKNNTLALILAAISLCVSLVCVVLVLQSGGAKQDEPAETVSDSTMQYVMYVGTNDKDTYQPEHTQEEAREIVDNVCLKYFDGYTLQEATGAWLDDAGVVTHEYSLVCYFDGADEAQVYKAADEIIEALNQSTVLIESNEISMNYYSGSN